MVDPACPVLLALGSFGSLLLGIFMVAKFRRFYNPFDYSPMRSDYDGWPDDDTEHSYITRPWYIWLGLVCWTGLIWAVIATVLVAGRLHVHIKNRQLKRAYRSGV